MHQSANRLQPENRIGDERQSELPTCDKSQKILPNNSFNAPLQPSDSEEGTQLGPKNSNKSVKPTESRDPPEKQTNLPSEVHYSKAISQVNVSSVAHLEDTAKDPSMLKIKENAILFAKVRYFDTNQPKPNLCPTACDICHLSVTSMEAKLRSIIHINVSRPLNCHSQTLEIQVLNSVYGNQQCRSLVYVSEQIEVGIGVHDKKSRLNP